MTTVEQLLGDLLLKHNCVIVPSFGGFVAKPISAKIDYKTGRIQPPGKSLLFNKQLINNDGLLINELALANDIPFSEAGDMVKRRVEEWTKILQLGERITIDKVGHIFRDAEKNLCFEQDRFFNLLLDSFGLGQVHFLSEEDVQIATQKHVLSVAQSNVDVAPKQPAALRPEPKIVAIQPKRNVWKYVAAACLAPVAFYSVWIPMKTDVLESGVISIRDFNPFYQQEEGSYQSTLPEEIIIGEKQITLEDEITDLPEELDVYTYAYDDDFTIPVEITASGEEVAAPDESIPAIQANSMHFIVGCFADMENATNLVSKLRSEGFDAQIVDVKNGLHRVSAGGALSIELLNTVRTTASSAGYQGWILKK